MSDCYERQVRCKENHLRFNHNGQEYDPSCVSCHPMRNETSASFEMFKNAYSERFRMTSFNRKTFDAMLSIKLEMNNKGRVGQLMTNSYMVF